MTIETKRIGTVTENGNSWSVAIKKELEAIGVKVSGTVVNITLEKSLDGKKRIIIEK